MAARGRDESYRIAQDLYSALQNEDKRYATTLLEYHAANPNLLLPSEGGVAPLHYAAGLGRDFLEILLKFKANPNLRSCDGSTPLHIATLWGDEGTVELLLQNGSDPCLQDENGDTPLELALEKGHVNIVRLMEACVTSEAETVAPRFSLQLKSVRRFFSSPFSSLNGSLTPDLSQLSDLSDGDHFTANCTDSSQRPQTALKNAKSMEKEFEMKFTTEEKEKRFGKENRVPERSNTIGVVTKKVEAPTRPRPKFEKSKSLSSLPKELPVSFSSCEILSNLSGPGSPKPFDTDTPDKSNSSGRRLDITYDVNTPTIGWKKRPMASEKCASRRSLNYSRGNSLSFIIDSSLETMPESEFEASLDTKEVNRNHIDDRTVDNQLPESPRDRVISSNLASPLGSVTTPPLNDAANRRPAFCRTVSDGRSLANGTSTSTYRKVSKMAKSLSCSALPKSSPSLKFSPLARPREKISIDMSDSILEFVESETACLDDTWDISDGLNTTKTLNKELEKLTISSASKHRLDVTNPDHPIVELKEGLTCPLEETRLDSRMADSVFSGDDSYGSTESTSPDVPLLSLYPVSSPAMPVLTPENCRILRANSQKEMPALTPQSDSTVSPPRLKLGTESNSPSERPSSGQSTVSNASIISLASVREYEYVDTETGQALIEQRFPSLASIQNNASSSENDDNDASPPDSLNSLQSISSVLTEVRDLDDGKLRERLVNLGEHPGPLTDDTRRSYMKRLTKLIREPAVKTQDKEASRKDYPFELRLILRGDPLPDQTPLEKSMVECFSDTSRQWREGKLKSSFNYILLDPAVSQNLPMRSDALDESDLFRTFIDAIFYIGKGKRSRPLCHFYEALSQKKDRKKQMSAKVSRILEIWQTGNGVISLHCYQNTIPVEAYTREAAMIDALGISNLTNVKRGDYYGQATTRSPKQRKQFGIHLLKKACQILLYEGERQIRPADIREK